MGNTTVPKHSVRLEDGGQTSVSLEPEFWDEVLALAERRGLLIGAWVKVVQEERGERNLSSALRLSVLAEKNRQIVTLTRKLRLADSGKSSNEQLVSHGSRPKPRSQRA